MTTKITGIVRDLEGRPLVNSQLRFERRSGVRAQAGATVVPRVVNAKTDAGGNISVDLYPGEYSAQAERGSGALSFKVGVPEDVAQVQLNDLIDQVPFITPSWTSKTRQARDEAVAAAESTAGSVEAAEDSASSASESADAASGSATAASDSQAAAEGAQQGAEEARDEAEDFFGHQLPKPLRDMTNELPPEVPRQARRTLRGTSQFDRAHPMWEHAPYDAETVDAIFGRDIG